MANEFKRSSDAAHVIFFEMVERADSNRQSLARLALSMANQDNGRAIVMSEMLNMLRWDEYQTMLSLLSLKAHTAILWSECELALLRIWADELAVTA